MPTIEIFKGPMFEIRAWGTDDDCPVLSFLDELETAGNSDHDRLLNLLKRTAREGIHRNNRQMRSLGDDIFEFKATNTGRILFFYDKGKLIICSHGFSGKKGNEKKFISEQIKTAVRIREAYLNERR
jgi:hypothetical protein